MDGWDSYSDFGTDESDRGGKCSFVCCCCTGGGNPPVLLLGYTVLCERDWGETTENADCICCGKEFNVEPNNWFWTKFGGGLFELINSFNFKGIVISFKLSGLPPLINSLDSWLTISLCIFDWTLLTTGNVVFSWKEFDADAFWLRSPPPKGTEEENCFGGAVCCPVKFIEAIAWEVFICDPLGKLFLSLLG